MLLVLCLVLSIDSKRTIGVLSISIVVLLNYIMLYIGYLGESKALNHMVACIGGFIPFALLFWFIFTKFVDWSKGVRGNVLYFLYLGTWSLYGLVYLLDESYKNIAMNILDSISKCFVGIGLWMYYTKIVVLTP